MNCYILLGILIENDNFAENCCLLCPFSVLKNSNWLIAQYFNTCAICLEEVFKGRYNYRLCATNYLILSEGLGSQTNAALTWLQVQAGQFFMTYPGQADETEVFIILYQWLILPSSMDCFIGFIPLSHCLVGPGHCGEWDISTNKLCDLE